MTAERRSGDAVLAEILAAVRAVDERLTRHMIDEEGEIAAIREAAVHGREAAERRHTTLIQSINSYMDKQAVFESAFLRNPDGTIDFSGHHDDHFTRNRWGVRLGKWLEDGFGNIVKIFMASGAFWLIYQAWEHLLKGPPK